MKNSNVLFFRGKDLAGIMSKKYLYVIALGGVAIGLGVCVSLVPSKTSSSGLCVSTRNYIEKTKNVSFGTEMPLHEPKEIVNYLQTSSCLDSFLSAEKDPVIKRRVVNLYYSAECGKKDANSKEFFLKAINDADSMVNNEAKNAMSLLRVGLPVSKTFHRVDF